VADTRSIAVNTVTTGRVAVCIREMVDRLDGRPVVLVHGNVSSSPFWFPLMNALPRHVRPIAVDLRGFGGTDAAPVDATRGLSDFADDVWATVDALGLEQVDLVGWSMGGGVVLQMLLDRPAAVTTVTLVNPVSPYGFGATAGTDGRLLTPDAAGSGAGSVNADFVKALDAGDTGDASPTSPRNILRSFYVAPGWDGEDEDFYLTSMLSTAVGPENYPGTTERSDSWPGVAPGRAGVLNTMAPTVFDVSGIVRIDPKPPILWVRGELDQIVSDTSMFDLNHLGALGAVPGWPGEDQAPAQPMVSQTRAVLQDYGPYTEVVVPGTGHSPHIEDTAAVVSALREHLGV
jgi:pimeloyl-ACP methyl ester carboxylesterase